VNNNQKKTYMPTGIVSWIVIMICLIVCSASVLLAYAQYLLGGIIIAACAIILITWVIAVVSRRWRLFVAISHLIIGGALVIMNLILIIGMATCDHACVAGGGMDAIIIVIMLSGPTAFNILYGLYFLNSKKVKAYFNN